MIGPRSRHSWARPGSIESFHLSIIYLRDSKIKIGKKHYYHLKNGQRASIHKFARSV